MTAFASYKKPSLAVDLVVFGYEDNKLSVLLLNRNEEPFKNEWTLPGGFVRMDDTFEETCTRILESKLGLAKLYLEQLYTFDDPMRDPRGRVVSVAYYSLINPARFKVVAGTMANDVKWFEVQKMPKLAFDHKKIFAAALRRLRSKILYFPVGFELLDDLFTMSELHQLYECILGTEIDRRNFSRKILDADFIINTGIKREGVKNRQPDLYKFNKKLKQNNFQLNIQQQ
ncbi:MAG: NUDIX domain-containing protein [Bacteroidota bacterium]